jgi:hypothetical protein
MSDMQVPVTDAFDQTDQLQSLQVELTPEQIEWLEEMAAERGLSLDHMLRTLVNAQMRGVDEKSTEMPSDSGDGAMHSVSGGDSAPPASPSASDTTDEEDERSDPPSIVESLRSASEQLQNLTTKDEGSDAEDSDLHDTLTRLKARLGNTSDADGSPASGTPGTAVLANENRSMFDMMDDE